MRILLWHVHGGWTDAFVRGRHTYVLPTGPDGGPWGLGRAGRDWPESVIEVAPGDLADADIDVVVLQRVEEIAECERLLGRTPGTDLPAVFVEHNTPRRDIVGTVHPLADRTDIPVVHVTHFNDLFWDSGRARTIVIEHGIVDPGYLYSGDLQQLALVINEPVRRGRITGTDLLPRFAGVAPLEVFGMGTDTLADALDLGPGELRIGGDLPTKQLHARLGRSRAYVHPLRWTSLGLSLLEAMHVGLPVLVLATTEAARAVPPGAGAVSTSVADLLRAAARLIEDPDEARTRGLVAREAALSRYGLARFLSDWDGVLDEEASRLRGLLVTERRAP
ncbi:glycosyltransferase family 4 protein [Arthrobacter echini]|uniref:Glycosyltransferase family 4 protein n=1 Tax=Arthrobacter echini TaxID=1529066 RepID=A0A5D0XT97_9MICC|nr:glycosyltransferase [Arthrobacter echini]TYC99591.1 glycosyltransferase family 4 protein [Arthrobacter echini]